MRLLKHPKMNDVAMLVFKSFYVTKTGKFKLKVRWINIVGRPFDTGVQENLTMAREKFMEFEGTEEVSSFLSKHGGVK